MKMIHMTQRETLRGWLYLGFQLLLLPVLLVQGNAMLGAPLAEAQLNFTYFAINYLGVFFLFRRFIAISADQTWKRPGKVFLSAALALAVYSLCAWGFDRLAPLVDPGYFNANDQSLAAMGNLSLLLIGTVFLVPMTEEILYRGLVFGSLYPHSRLAAYLASAAVFSAIHVIGYAGTLPGLTLALSFLQYLPAGLCLAWAYANSGTIFTPILVHALINAYGIYSMR